MILKYELRLEGETSIETLDRFDTMKEALEYVQVNLPNHHKCPVLKDLESGQEWYADWNDEEWLAMD